MGVSVATKSRSVDTPPEKRRESTVVFPQIVIGIAKVPVEPTVNCWLVTVMKSTPGPQLVPPTAAGRRPVACANTLSRKLDEPDVPDVVTLKVT
jgi:hypothetical protein